jgi:serine/threonine protein kinase
MVTLSRKQNGSLVRWIFLSIFWNNGFQSVTAFTSLQLPQLPTTTRTIRDFSTIIANALPKIEDWEILDNGRVVGTIFDHPTLPNGDTITTSPITRPGSAAPRKTVTTISGSKYQLGTPVTANAGLQKGDVSLAELQKRARVAFDLTGDIVGENGRKYLLAGKPSQSTSGKSMIFKAYMCDDDQLPTGSALTIKISKNWEAIEREAENYARITKAGFLRGQFVELLDYLPDAAVYSKRFKNQSALVMERGAIDLKRYISVNGQLEGRRLRDAAAAAAQCIQAIHSSKLVWTDMKTENFVVDASGLVKGIDLESAMAVKGNPVDYSPEGTPPEFATAFLAGEGPEFILEYSYDIWSFGMLLYELAVGRGYFDGKKPVQIIKSLRDGLDIDLSAIKDPKLKSLIDRCLTIEPSKRPNIYEVLLHPFFLTTGLGPLSFGK